jgi:hypothetical protein
MVESLFEADDCQSLFRRQGVLRNLCDQRDILTCRQACHQVVKLEHESDVTAPELGQLALAGIGQVTAAKEQSPTTRPVESAQYVQQR